MNTLLSGDAFDFHCHSNLTRAILPYGLAESDVHDVINLFQVTGLNRDGEYFMSVPYPNPSVSHVGKPSNDNNCGVGEMKGTLSRQSRRFLRILRRDRRPLRSVDVSWGGSVRVGMG